MPRMNKTQFQEFQTLLEKVQRYSPFYQEKFREEGFDIRSVQTPDDIVQVPFTQKEDLRNAYPLGLIATAEENIVRIHSSSGTTGQPVIIPYTAGDVVIWAEMMKRCMEYAGVTKKDRVQITPGYGLWTAGIGFQAGCEALGAMAVPMGPGNTEKQLKMMLDLQTTVFCSTSSYALLLAEMVEKRELFDKIALRVGIIGSEQWGDKMRARIAQNLGIELFDIYGLTEVYGPGISIDCQEHKGLHYWDDYLYFEVIDPTTGSVLPEGELGELVITTLRKEGAPVIRYRTHDLTRLIPGQCPCGSPFPRHDRLLGRTDDMIKVKGVNMFPAQIAEVIQEVPGISSEYQIVLDHVEGKDRMCLRFETEFGDPEMLSAQVIYQFKQRIGIKIDAEAVAIGELPRSEKKTQRVIDNRYQ